MNTTLWLIGVLGALFGVLGVVPLLSENPAYGMIVICALSSLLVMHMKLCEIHDELKNRK